MISRAENRSNGNTTETTHIADDVADLGPSLNDLLDDDYMESAYLSASRARYPNHDREAQIPISSLDISMPDPYARYYSTDHPLARAISHTDEYAASAMRYAPRYNTHFYHLKLLGSNDSVQLYELALNIWSAF